MGCGSQPYRSLIPVAATYHGLDYSGARANFGYSMPETTYYEGDRWPIDDTTADVVLCTETLEHVPDPSVFLSEAFRCLKPGGRILLTVPFAARWHFIPHDYWRFTPSGLQRLLARPASPILPFMHGGMLSRWPVTRSWPCSCLYFCPSKGAFGKVHAPLCWLAGPAACIMLAAIANLSLRSKGGDDCLGYTAVSVRPVDLAKKDTK